MAIQPTNLSSPRVDLIKGEFDRLIDQKGRDVILEKALQCPCKSSQTNQQSACKNCGGTGWVFINPVRTRMILAAINIVNEYRPWSEELRGTVNITCKAEEELTVMDKITSLDGEAIFTEVLFFKQKNADVFTYSTYNIKKMLYIGMYSAANSPLIRLKEGIDYTVDKNIIRLKNTTLITEDPNQIDVSITVRYKHAPEFHVIEVKRETMQTFEWQNQEVLRHMPVSAIARRAHYQLQAANLAGDRLLNNSYTE